MAAFPHWFSDLQSEGYYVDKGQLDAIKTASTQEDSKFKARPYPWGNAEIRASLKDLKDAGVTIPPHPPAALPASL